MACTLCLAQPSCLVNVRKDLLIHPALGAMTDTGSPLQMASQLVPSYVCCPEHIASLGMTPCCFGTVSLGRCRQPHSHSDHVAPAASSHGAAPGTASRPASCHMLLLTGTCLLHIPKASQGQLGQTGTTQKLQCELNQVRQSQTAPYTYLATGRRAGPRGTSHVKIGTEPSETGRDRLWQGEAEGQQERETHNSSKVQIRSERSLPSLQPKGNQISHLCHPWRGAFLSISCARTKGVY